MIANGQKRTKTGPTVNDTDNTSSCQEKTLVVINSISEKKNKIEVYPNCIKLKPAFSHLGETGYKPPLRGKISEFSKKSRFRLFELLSKITTAPIQGPLFVTLTYHYGHTGDEYNNHTHLHNFLVQLRNFDNNVSFIWRKEYQKRGAPHYHLIIFPGLGLYDYNFKDYKKLLFTIWHRIADPKSRMHKDYGVFIRRIKSYKEACIYLSKYVAKVPEGGPDIIEGRHWGNSRNLPIDKKGTMECLPNHYHLIIERIRKWLIKRGKVKTADPIFLNDREEQTVFISFADFKEISNFEKYKIKEE